MGFTAVEQCLDQSSYFFVFDRDGEVALRHVGYLSESKLDKEMQNDFLELQDDIKFSTLRGRIEGLIDNENETPKNSKI